MAKKEKAPKDSEKDTEVEVDADNETDADDTDAKADGDDAVDDDPRAAADGDDELDSDDALDSDADDDAPQRSEAADSFWEKVGVEPVEIALPKGVGLTLRAYRMSDTIAVDDEEAAETAEAEESEEAEEAEAEVVEEKPKSKRDKKKDKKGKKAKDEDEESSDDEASGSDDESDEDEDGDSDDKGKNKKDEEADEEPEEIPVFLSQDGALPLFETPEALVAFVKSEAPTELRAIDTWDELAKGIKAEYVVPSADDSYELDLVVKNLRGGHDTWDPELMIGAGELARDLGFALKLPTVMSTLSVGSPLDDLDNALRSVVDGGIKAMFAKRKVRKVGTQQTTLAWRGIITKIAETVDWRN